MCRPIMSSVGGFRSAHAEIPPLKPSDNIKKANAGTNGSVNSKSTNVTGKTFFSVSEKTHQDCKALGLKITFDQLKRISEVAQEVLLSGVGFKNVNDGEFSAIPMHIFCNKAERTVEVCFKGEPNQPLNTGALKSFSQAVSLLFSTTHLPTVQKVAALRGILKTAIERKKSYKFEHVWDCFRTEIEILKKLKGKSNICQFRNFACYEETVKEGDDVRKVPEFIMYQDLYDGDMSTLALKYPEKFKDREFILKFFEGSLNALAVIHNEGIIHRDIKYDNIFLRIMNAEVFFGDFDLSGMKPMRPTDLIGSLSFMAPEQMFGYESLKRDVTNKIGIEIKPDMCSFPMDIWALGIVFSTTYDKLVSLKPIEDFPQHFLTNITKMCNWPELKSGETNDLSTDNQWAALKNVIEAMHGEPFPVKDPIRALIWHMLRPNPDDRLTIKEAQKFFKDHVQDRKPLSVPLKKKHPTILVTGSGGRALTPHLMRPEGVPSTSISQNHDKGRCSFVPRFLRKILVG